MNNIEHEQQDSSESSNMNAQSMLSVKCKCYFTGQICGFSSLDGNYEFLRFFLKRCAPPGFRFAHLVPPLRRRPGAATGLR